MKWALSWALYWLGDLASKIMSSRCEDGQYFAEQWVGFWYPIYNKLMWWSTVIQGETENGPWRAVSNEEEDSSPEQE